jgi:TATA-binding protein-associated factor Taf7
VHDLVLKKQYFSFFKKYCRKWVGHQVGLPNAVLVSQQDLANLEPIEPGSGFSFPPTRDPATGEINWGPRAVTEAADSSAPEKCSSSMMKEEKEGKGKEKEEEEEDEKKMEEEEKEGEGEASEPSDEERKRNRHELLEELMPLVRLPEMSYDELQQVERIPELVALSGTQPP